MEFGTIVHQRRLQRGWNVQTLMEKSSISDATISRIENGKSKALVDSTIRLCETLNIDPKEFIHIGNLDNLHIQIRPHSTTKEVTFLSRSDLTELIVLLLAKPASIFNRILDYSKRYLQADFPNFSFGEFIIGIKPIKEDNKAIDHIIGLFQKSNYPDFIENQLIVETNNHGGAIMLIDIAHYMREARRNRGLTLIDLQNLVEMPESALSNWENAIYKKIKMDDVFILDKALKTQGEFTTLVWNACEFYPFISDGKLLRRLTNQEISLCNAIICIYRNLQSQDSSSPSQWLNAVRALY
jgi:transcriptional regulator with XRE-family HTH domain